MKLFLCTSAVVLATAVAQQAATMTAETHPAMSSQVCTAPGSCTTESTKIVLDANWRWLHKVGGSTNCYTGNKWDATLCPDSKTCVENCALDGAEYSGTYGIQTSGNSVSIKLVTHGPYSTNIGSRLYLMADDTKYRMYKLLNKEFTFDVDVSNLPCGLNGALYFSQMDEDGGMKRYSGNKAGAKYGTGYCDAQCARDIKFIGGDANVKNWKPSETDVNAGTGSYGSCCAEMDIWEANSIANAYTTHPCKKTEPVRCESDADCGTGSGNRYNGQCDMDGCDLNPFRMGDKTFFGPGSKFKVDTTKPMTVVTQFVTDDGTDNGTLKEIRRVYKQGDKVIENAVMATKGVDKVNYITDSVCSQMKTAFGDKDDHKTKGGFKQMGESMKKGMVLVMSLWDDHAAHCLWLDSKYPADKDASVPGVLRGSCETTTGDPKDVEANSPDATVKFSNIKFGAIGSTTPGVGKPSGSGSSSETPSTGSDAAEGGNDTEGSDDDAPGTVAPAGGSDSSNNDNGDNEADNGGDNNGGDNGNDNGNDNGSDNGNGDATGSDDEGNSGENGGDNNGGDNGGDNGGNNGNNGGNGGGDGAAMWGQCGGQGWNGPTSCKEGSCKKLNDWYSQCL